MSQTSYILLEGNFPTKTKNIKGFFYKRFRHPCTFDAVFLFFSHASQKNCVQTIFFKSYCSQFILYFG